MTLNAYAECHYGERQNNAECRSNVKTLQLISQKLKFEPKNI